MEAGTIELLKKLIHNINQSIMKANIFFKTLFTILIIAIIFSCSNDDNNIPNQIKSAKFEITGNYSGHIFIVYSDNISGNTSATITSLPWSKTIDYPNSVVGIGISGNAVTSNAGVAGQTASLKIYNGTTVVSQSNKTADANGLFNFNTLTYIFP